MINSVTSNAVLRMDLPPANCSPRPLSAQLSTRQPRERLRSNVVRPGDLRAEQRVNLTDVHIGPEHDEIFTSSDNKERPRHSDEAQSERFRGCGDQPSCGNNTTSGHGTAGMNGLIPHDKRS